MPKAELVCSPGVEVVGRFASRPFALDHTKLGLDRGDDGLGDLVLQGENVVQFSVVAFGPYVMSIVWVQARSA